MAVAYWIARPSAAVARVRYAVWEKLNPDKPWLCPGSIDFCQAHLDGAALAFEFGSGRSTSWFSKRVAHLISIECRIEWYDQVRQQLDAEGIRNVDLRLVPLDHPWSEGERESYSPTPAYVAAADALADASVRLAIVDGHYRTHCVRHLVPKIEPGGYLLVDDANRWPSLSSLPIPASWKIVNNSTNGIKRTVIWQAL
jgi:hypothetical protein